MLKCSSVQLILFASLLLIVLLGIEVGVFYLLNWGITYWYATLILMIILHLIMVRFLIPICLYEWKVFFVRYVHYYRSGRNRAIDFKKKLKSTKDLLLHSHESKGINNVDRAKNMSVNKLNTKIKKSKEYIESYIQIFESLFIKNHPLSIQQQMLLRSLRALNNSLSLDMLQKQLPLKLNSDNNNKDIIDLTEKRQSLELLMNFNAIIRILDDYSFDGQKGFSFKKLIKIFNEDLLANHHISRVVFERTYKLNALEEHQVRTKDNAIIDYVIIKSSPGPYFSNEKPNLLIYSGPNGGPFELISKSGFIDVFLSNGIDILHWNYRGYGYSTGIPTFNKGRDDICAVYDDVIRLNRWNKIGTTGRSIGGLSSCYLAHQRKVDVLIADRNFSSIESLVKAFPLGHCIYWIYKALFVSSSFSVENYIKSNCYKILMYDPQDEIINEFGSLKTGISQYILKNSLMIKETKQDEELVNLKSEGLEQLLSSNNIMNDNKNKSNSFDNILDAILTPKEKKDFIDILIECIDLINNNAYWAQFSNIGIDQSSNSVKDKNLRQLLIKFFYSFPHSSDNFPSVLKFKGNRRKRAFIDIFFSNLFIWGCNKKNSNHITLFKNNKVKDEIKKAITTIESITSTLVLKQLETNPLYHKALMLIDLLKKIEKSTGSICFKKQIANQNYSEIHLESIELKEDDALTEELLSVGRGNIIKLNGGHNGFLTELELKTLLYHLEQAQFLN